MPTVEEEDAWVYEAIRDALTRLAVLHFLAEPINQIHPDNLDHFVSQALEHIGFDSPDRRNIAVDIPEDCLFSGSFSEPDGLIHLQKSALDPWNILHEVAHWMAPGDRHRENWRQSFRNSSMQPLAKLQQWHLHTRLSSLNR